MFRCYHSHTLSLTPSCLVSAANWVALGILYNTGQDCTAGSRLYVQDSIYDKFLALLISKAKALVITDGFDEKAGGGPVVCFTTSPLFVESQELISAGRYQKPTSIACGDT